MHQNGAQVFDAVVLREFVEHLERQRGSELSGVSV